MAKINFFKTFFTVSILAASVLNAQKTANFVKLSPKKFTSTFKKKSETPIFSQSPNPEVFVASTANVDGSGVFVAEDFELSQTTEVKNFDFVGYNDADNLADTFAGAVLYIYEDNNGKPAGIPGKSGTPVFSLDLQPDDPRLYGEQIVEQFYGFIVDTSGFVAQANKRYWVIFAPKVNFATTMFADEEMWNWLFSPDVNYSDSMIVDPDNNWGANFTTWYSLNDTFGAMLGEDLRAMYISLYDENFLSAASVNLAKEISLYPNPATTDFTVKVKDFAKSEILDMNGRLVKTSTSETTSISELPKGIYTVKVTVKNGKAAIKKLIKK